MPGARRKQKIAWAALAVLLAFGPRAASQPASRAWPSFLAPPDTFSSDTVAAIEHVWLDPTIHRTVRGRTAHVPFDVYIAFVDTPEVTAAAARFRKLARYEVRPLGDGWYSADDHAGARGFYRVLARGPTRRVILSWGEHGGSILGTVTGSALSVLDFEPRGDTVSQELTAYVKIDNTAAAALARLFIVVFGRVADHKLTEGFTVTAEVAEWAVERPGEFCDWLQREPLNPDSRELVRSVLPDCREPG